ncbi:hypothetical protein TIFTF001_009516 [Ficus carica]|uniref:Uncharacterized protein n=1 Tax=Ficus carica TaxID=3494 RepID=A0AA88D3N8_FICCA|nr:hypothetical protein TIFTF001_009516 [Ficus carica]
MPARFDIRASCNDGDSFREESLEKKIERGSAGESSTGIVCRDTRFALRSRRGKWGTVRSRRRGRTVIGRHVATAKVRRIEGRKLKKILSRSSSRLAVVGDNDKEETMPATVTADSDRQQW